MTAVEIPLFVFEAYIDTENKAHKERFYRGCMQLHGKQWLAEWDARKT